MAGTGRDQVAGQVRAAGPREVLLLEEFLVAEGLGDGEQLRVAGPGLVGRLAVGAVPVLGADRGVQLAV